MRSIVLSAAAVALLAVVRPAPAADDSAAKREAEQAASCRALEEIKAADAPEKVYETFNRFCKANFGALAEPLVYELFGRKPAIVEGSIWVHASESSAAIGWMTSLPAVSHVEFGGGKTAETERPFYVHLHHLTGLKPGTSGKCRLVSVAEDGAEVVTEVTVTPKRPDGAMSLPGGLAGPPYVIDKPGYWLLDRDITAPRTAIEVKCEGVTLDLGGHTVTFATEETPKDEFTDKWMSFVLKGSFGVKNMGGSKFRLLNGTVMQGAPGNRGNDESEGFNPVYIRDCGDVEMAGVLVDFHAPQCTGVRFRSSLDGCAVHHNVVRDRGNMMQNRHGAGCGAVDFLAPKGSRYEVRYNLVSRIRQNGLRGPLDRLESNEIYVDSWATNSFATSVKNGGEMLRNRIFCTGYHAIACPWGDGVKVRDNFVHMQGINTGKTRWWEGFGDQNSMNGLRHTQWGGNKTESTDSEYARNVVCIYGRDGAQIRGVEFFSDTYIKGLTLRDSTIKVVSQDEATVKAACVATQGLADRKDAQNPVLYVGCTFISNINILRLGDDYGVGCNHRFLRCRFVRDGKDPRFRTVTAMGAYWSTGHELTDCAFEGGASPEEIDWGQTKPGTRDFAVKWTLTVKAKPGAEVAVTDSKGTEVFKGPAPAAGSIEIPLAQFRMSHAGKEALTPHTVSCGGRTERVTMDSRKEIDLR